jgi:hypothetical protein
MLFTFPCRGKVAALLRGGWGSAAALPHAGRFAANPPPAGEGGEHVQPLLSAIKWDSSVCN